MSDTPVTPAATAPPRATPDVVSVSPMGEAWRRLRRNPVAVVCMIYIGLLVFVALFANFLAPYPYDMLDVARYKVLPSPPDHIHLLGTDTLGEDVLSRLLYGARVSLGVSVVVVVIELVIGVVLGIIAGFRGGLTDLFLMRVTDVMFAFPDLLLAILLAAVIRSSNQAIPPVYSLLALFVALGVVAWPSMARLVRGQALQLREKEFIEASRAMGLKESRIILRHMLPNLMSPIIVQVTQDLAVFILAESTLSFLGIGVQPPFPSWGRMINDALAYKESMPMLMVWPAVVLALTVMSFNFFGDALRDAIDPRLRE